MHKSYREITHHFLQRESAKQTNKLVTKCRHENEFYLVNYKEIPPQLLVFIIFPKAIIKDFLVNQVLASRAHATTRGNQEKEHLGRRQKALDNAAWADIVCTKF